MEKIQTVEDFYKSKFNWMPDNLKKEMGHFNVFRRDEFLCCKKRAVPYSRKDYYKISLMKGKNLIHFADKTILCEKYALLFADPMIPYNLEPLEENQQGFFCIFTEEFFNSYGILKEYPMFRPAGNKVYILPDDKLEETETIFLKMIDEINSDFIYKYDAIRGLVFALVHSAVRMQPAESSYPSTSNASARIVSLFVELLERQFPIESPVQTMKLRYPADFSNQLNIHVNHLNRSMKEVTGKTTTQLISERLLLEARTLLKHTNWNVAEIAYCLGFEELPHFINFFKRNTNLTPKNFRNNPVI
jgi:AraC-like DNA-binding protein